MPTSATAAPASASVADRSPRASESENGTSAEHAAIGATMLIVPIESAQ
jgi:hypothetical protein